VACRGAGGTPALPVIRSATLNPARYLGKEKDLGTVEKGKLADLLLLNANPLEDVGNTKKIAAVVTEGSSTPRRTWSRCWPTSNPWRRRSERGALRRTPEAEMQSLVDAGWFGSLDEVVLDALRRFVDTHREDLMQGLVREDVEWGLRGTD
jgi:hypothetical protein